MRTITVDDLTRQPRALIEDAQRGNPVIVSSAGEPLLLALPLGIPQDLCWTDSSRRATLRWHRLHWHV